MLLHPAVARDGEGMRVVPAQEILDKIERGEPVAYYHVIVDGDHSAKAGQQNHIQVED